MERSDKSIIFENLQKLDKECLLLQLQINSSNQNKTTEPPNKKQELAPKKQNIIIKTEDTKLEELPVYTSHRILCRKSKSITRKYTFISY